MLLWANAHRGFPIGHLLLATYLVAESLRYFSGRGALSRRGFRIFSLLAIGAALAALVNPRLGGSFLVTARELGSPFLVTIDEFLPVWEYVRWSRQPLLLPGLALLLAGSAATLVAAWRRLEWRHLFLFSGFAVAGAGSFRFSIFFVLFSVAIASGYLPAALREPGVALRRFACGAVVVVAALLLFSSVTRHPFPRGSLVQGVHPEQAADFIPRQPAARSALQSLRVGRLPGLPPLSRPQALRRFPQTSTSTSSTATCAPRRAATERCSRSTA